MQSGKLRHRVTIQEENITRNSVGEEIITWSTVTTVWAEVQGTSGAERLIAQSNVRHDNISYVITIRFRNDISLDHKQRVKKGSQYFQIEAIFDKDGDKRELTLLCSDEGETS